MITKPTLFILGAGASIPYGFPSGADLRSQICQLTVGSGGVLMRNLSGLGIPMGDIYSFANSFMQSRLSSIDAFLSKRQEFSEIGKLVIAAILIPREASHVLDDFTNKEDWYFTLWNTLAGDASSIEELGGNNVRIFTFNYDRSLERYLHTSIMDTFNVSQQVALEALEYFEINHVYGSLGTYGVNDDFHQNVRAYKPNLSKEAVRVAAACIKVIPESRAEDTIFDKSKEAFMWADHVCFLGFGFDRLNVQRLGFREISENSLTSDLPSKIVTSLYDKKLGEIELAKDSILGDAQVINDYGELEPQWDYAVDTSLATLRQFAWLLQ
jgi:hypothetical protein